MIEQPMAAVGKVVSVEVTTSPPGLGLRKLASPSVREDSPFESVGRAQLFGYLLTALVATFVVDMFTIAEFPAHPDGTVSS